MNDCIFCSIIKNERKEKIFVVFETEKTLAILDLFPVSDGHVLLITKNHVSDVTELDNES